MPSKYYKDMNLMEFLNYKAGVLLYYREQQLEI